MWGHVIVLSSLHIAPLLAARNAGAASARVSPDLGLTEVEVVLAPDGVRFPEILLIPWSAIERIARAGERKAGVGSPCFVVEPAITTSDSMAAEAVLCERISVFSERTGRVCSLTATSGAPTIILAGFPMHRTKDVDPWRDTQLKLATIAPLTGRVLDTTTGLGYTAIGAARTAAEVVTVELDPTVLAVARLNPWSRPLFESKAITQLIGDSADVVRRFEDGSFARIIHDPPTVSLAGNLYSREFYADLHRVLTRGGILFHYVGDLRSGLGRRVASGVTRRLREAGFARVRLRPEAYGLVATK
jgi:uncharacterized protein